MRSEGREAGNAATSEGTRRRARSEDPANSSEMKPGISRTSRDQRVSNEERGVSH